MNSPAQPQNRRSRQPQPGNQDQVTAPKLKNPKSLKDQIAMIRSSAMPVADQDRVINALRARAHGEAVDDLSSIPGDESAGAGSALYGSLNGYGAGQLETMATDRRRHPENDPTLLDIVGAGLGAAGAAAGAYNYRGRSQPSLGTSGRTTVITPQRQYYPTAPRPNQSDITGLGK